MTTYTVQVLTKVDSIQLLLINDGTQLLISVYDEHSGTTLMRMTAITPESLAVALTYFKIT
jgi:hypothetical protein